MEMSSLLIYNESVIGYANLKNRKDYDNRGEYNYQAYHNGNKNYRDEKIRFTEMRESGNLRDAYTGRKLGPNTSGDVDHIGSAKSLHGVAGSNAALAALGGGAKAFGGGEMALGAQVLGGAVAGPILAVAGLLVQAKGKSSEEKSEEIIKEIEEVLRTKEVRKEIDITKQQIEFAF